jgi:hypothetical protein
MTGLFLNFAGPAQGQIFFSNIRCNCSGGMAVEGSNYTYDAMAAEFSPAVSGNLGSISAEVFQGIGDPYFNISIFANSVSVPGTLIENVGTDLTAPQLGGIVTATSALHPLLVAGQPYWVVVSAFDNSTQIGWEVFGTSSIPETSDSGTGWFPYPSLGQLQFEVDGAPEPSSFILFSSALAIVAAGFSRQRSQRDGSARN